MEANYSWTSWGAETEEIGNMAAHHPSPAGENRLWGGVKVQGAQAKGEVLKEEVTEVSREAA